VPSPHPAAAAKPEIVFYGVADAAGSFAPALNGTFRTAVVPTLADAVARLARVPPAMVITHVALDNSDGLVLCGAAKRCSPPATVLVTARDPEAVPPALAAGCDGVLLEPFVPNLLYARLGRLMRDRANNPNAHGTNRFWAHETCARCRTRGVTTFEFHSHRRAWYACTRCRHVWIGRRLEAIDRHTRVARAARGDTPTT
jgi:CheY-like chemotaxis protein